MKSEPGWMRLDRWPQVEFYGNYLEDPDFSRPGKKANRSLASRYAKWRCVWCKEWIPEANYSPGLSWDDVSPCVNESCKARFKLRYPGGV